MATFIACKKDDLKPGEKKLLSVDHKSIVLVRTPDSNYHAVSNICPHEGAKMCDGLVGGTFMSENTGNYDYVKDGEVIRCPWHGYEFDVTSGCSLFEPDKYKIKKYDVSLEEDLVVIHF